MDHASGFALQPRACDLDELEGNGFVVLERVLEPRRCSALARELEPWLEATPRCEGDFYGWATTRVGGLLSKAPAMRDLVLQPYVLALARALLQPNCDCMQLNLTQAVRVHPGERAQAPHRDEEMWPPANKAGHWLVNVMWAIDEFTAENGATRLWPGSHRHALDRGIEPAASVAAAMPRGSALLFLGSLTHGAGANISAAPRTGVIVSYCLGWLKPYENQFLAYPREVAQGFPEELQRLIGYQIHRPNLGGWEGRDPIEFLRPQNALLAHADALTPEIARDLKTYYGD